MSFCSRQHKTNYFIIYYFFFIFFFHEQTLPQVEHMTKEKNSQFEHTTKNPQKPNYFSGSIHDQTFPQVDHTNKNLLRGTNNSKMLLGCNAAGRERHEPTTRKKCATNKKTKNKLIADQMALKHYGCDWLVWNSNQSGFPYLSGRCEQRKRQ